MNKIIQKELQYVVKNYKPLPIVFNRGKGIYLYTLEKKKYIDCISGYSSLNQGHVHSDIYKAMKSQAKKLTLTSRALMNDKLGIFSEKICNLLDYEQLLMMNSGVEGGESALKIARAWGYKKKGIPKNKAIHLFCIDNFWGRTLSACSSSSDPDCYENFGPNMPGMFMIPYGNTNYLEQFFINNPNTVSFMLEPIQGEAGVIIPPKNYLEEVRNLCNKYNVLMILDEVQTGLGRTGKLCNYHYYSIKPDLLVLGKALSGGFYPVSAVLGDQEIMDVLTPGTHGSTFGGNPLACSIASASLDVILNQKLTENSYKKGNFFRNELNLMKNKNIKEIRGMGLLNAVETYEPEYAQEIHAKLLKEKVLTKITHSNKIRISPPLIINNKQMNILLEKFNKALQL
jgi:ornithine--oxo-acid transaminase